MALVLSLFGSPRDTSVSSHLHERFLAPLAAAGHEVRRYAAYAMDVRPCIACGHCRDSFSCVHDDEMTALYPLLVQARLVSVSSPVYFSGLPGPLKTVIDRCQALWELARRECISGARDGFFISVGEGDYPRQFEPSVVTMRHFFNSIGCRPLESDYLLVRADPDASPEHIAEAARAETAGIRSATAMSGRA
ncbi:MAG TPA: flavodoxin family protein [Spirochaetota bacterium]|nr:flavodoxin family protein [Spirochaetota bacterium]HNT09341.1 flavodoxin family protein [Spirochaetota bacterium]HNV45541.1 flavodoxin family protein [Spirochaetota bacterium]HOS39165.1 flavodoxin family protein [Spirochaetota bacterium]HPI23071.1 flavodoxin family protein [Spirochaetota bacterium]